MGGVCNENWVGSVLLVFVLGIDLGLFMLWIFFSEEVIEIKRLIIVESRILFFK